MFSPKPMSWSRPRESFRPQLLSSSSEGSVSRPDFCTASLQAVFVDGFHGLNVFAMVSRIEPRLEPQGSGVTLQPVDRE